MVSSFTEIESYSNFIFAGTHRSRNDKAQEMNDSISVSGKLSKVCH